MFEILLNFAFLLASLAVLIWIADKLVNHSVRLAATLGVSGTVIGLTLLAYGTSMPELAVSAIASFQAHTQLSISNIIGSNIYNIAVILGLAALIVPFAFRTNHFRRDGCFMMVSAVLLLLLALLGIIGKVTGLAMIVALALYTWWVIKSGKRTSGGLPKSGSTMREFGLCCALLVGIMIAGYFVVQFAVATARLAGITEWLIGSTIVAAGTSMPETVVSIVAARKKQIGMSLGNIVGSSYFNILWILGVSAMLRPLAFSIQAIWLDLIFLLTITAAFYIALLRGRISRPEGLAYLALYGLYVAYLLGFLPVKGF